MPMLASVSAASSASLMTISRTVSSHHHSMVALPVPLAPLAAVPMPVMQAGGVSAASGAAASLLTVASMCQSAATPAAPWTTTAASLQQQAIANGDGADIPAVPEAEVYPPTPTPRCISDSESTVITQLADPSKQCSAGVQAQIDSDTVANECSPASYGSPMRDDAREGRGSPPPPASGYQSDETDGEESSSSGVVSQDRDEGLGPPGPLVAEADSNCDQEQRRLQGQAASPQTHVYISSSDAGLPENAETTVVPDKPNELDLSGLELLYKSIEHMESLEIQKLQEETEVSNEPPLPLAPEPGLRGLGLLCALAEQRINEEKENESEAPKTNVQIIPVESKPVKSRSDVNRNYRTPQSEQDVRRFLATRTESSLSNTNQSVTFKLTLPNEDDKEIEMRNQIAELQRMYKETQRELSRLTPRKNSTEGESSSGSLNGSPHSKRTPAKNAISRRRKPHTKKRTPLKTETLSDPPPPVLERVTDVPEVPLPKLKWSRLDAPPTLIPHKPPSDLPQMSPTSFKLNLVKLPATKDQKRRWSVDSSSARVSTETHHADDEDSDGLWPDFISKTSETSNGNRKHKSSTDNSSSSKRRKVGKPKRHLDKAGNGHHSTETIVPKQPRNKANLFSFLLASKSAGAPGKFPTSEHRVKDTPKTETATAPNSPEHRPKIRPKLKAEVKVKESWEEEDLLDWSTPRPQLPSHPLKVLDLDCESMAEITVNGQGKNSGQKRHEHDDDVDWVPSSKKPRTPSTPSKAISIPSFPQHKNPEKQPSGTKSRKPVNVAKERRQSTDKMHLKKPVCSSVDESMAAKISSDPKSCVLTVEILESADLPVRTLTAQGGLFYSGWLNAVMPPDVYSIALHGERSSRPNIYSREEILQDTILEVRPPSVETLSVGTRLCAYWSQQTKCLYPGTVVPPSTPDPTLDGDFVTVEFDDGDSGQIRIQDIRLLPPDYPVVEFDPNPLLSLTKRRRRNSEKSVDSKDRRVSADSAFSSNASITENSKEEMVCGENTADVIVKEHPVLEASSVFENSSSNTLLPSEILESERKRLKKRRREKLKRLLTNDCHAADARKKKRKHKDKEKRRHRHSSTGSSSDIFKTDLESVSSDDVRKSLDSTKDPESPGSVGEVVEQDIEIIKEDKEDTHIDVEKEEEKEEADEETCVSPLTSTLSLLPETAEKVEESVLSDEDLAEKKPKKKHERQNSSETSKMAAFLPPRKLWGWSGKGYKRQGGKGRKKEFYKCIQRDKEIINVGDCAVFLSTNSPDRPYIGRIESLWETSNGMMVVRVKWFYHPEETEGCPSLKYQGGLFQSDHADDNDVQTISHRCEVLPISDYEKKVLRPSGRPAHLHDVYYLAGFYDPKNIHIKLEKGVAG